MAERRMFAKSVIGSARFLRMPPTSRLLYYDLGMQADDDGVVESFSVMRTTGATEDDLKVAEDNIQKLTDKSIEEIDAILANKEKEIISKLRKKGFSEEEIKDILNS